MNRALNSKGTCSEDDPHQAQSAQPRSLHVIFERKTTGRIGIVPGVKHMMNDQHMNPMLQIWQISYIYIYTYIHTYILTLIHFYNTVIHGKTLHCKPQLK